MKLDKKQCLSSQQSHAPQAIGRLLDKESYHLSVATNHTWIMGRLAQLHATAVIKLMVVPPLVAQVMAAGTQENLRTAEVKKNSVLSKIFGLIP